jgi:predicted nuclease of predicted toxin-antitoxin system
VGRFLVTRLDLDVLSLQGQRLGQLPDREVIQMARSAGRVIITLDRDFADYFAHTERPDIGIIYLDLPNSLRTIPDINRLLAELFRRHASSIDLEHSLETITLDQVPIRRG